MTRAVLKACPFCGGRATVQQIIYYYVACAACGVRVHRDAAREDRSETIRRWNRRAPGAARGKK